MAGSFSVLGHCARTLRKSSNQAKSTFLVLAFVSACVGEAWAQLPDPSSRVQLGLDRGAPAITLLNGACPAREISETTRTRIYDLALNEWRLFGGQILDLTETSSP